MSEERNDEGNVLEKLEAKLNELRESIPATPVLYIAAAGGERLLTPKGCMGNKFPTFLARQITGEGKTPLEMVLGDYEGLPAIDLTRAEFDHDHPAVANSPTVTADTEKVGTTEEDGTPYVSLTGYIDYWREQASHYDGIRFGQVRNGELVWEGQESA